VNVYLDDTDGSKVLHHGVFATLLPTAGDEDGVLLDLHITSTTPTKTTAAATTVLVEAAAIT
jgi:hypothetical protein